MAEHEQGCTCGYAYDPLSPSTREPKCDYCLKGKEKTMNQTVEQTVSNMSVTIRSADLAGFVAGLVREGLTFEVVPDSEGEYKVYLLGGY